MVKKRQLDLTPSSADRWTTCTASPQFILDNWELLPPDTGTSYSQEGTTAHEIASAMLEERAPRYGSSYHCPVPADAAMHWHTWNYMEYVEGLREKGSTLLVEQKLPLWYMPGRNAIVDAAVLNPAHLHVVDLKYGQGITVSTERNLQGVIYSRCIIEKVGYPPSDDFPVSIHIYQPRGRAAEDAPFHRWDTTWGEVNGIAKGVEETAYAIKYAHENNPGRLHFLPTPVFAPSEKACQWCPAKGFCAARSKATSGIELLDNLDTHALALPPSNVVTLEQRTAVQKHGAAIIKWINDVQAYNLESMRHGKPLPGFKLALSRGGNRKWADEKRAGKLLLEKTILTEEEVYERTVISVAEAEKMIGKSKFTAELTNLITKAPGWPIIVPEDDKRESYLTNPTSELTNLDAINLDEF